MERKIETTVDNILSLISCARDYGFERDVLFDAFREILNDKLTHEEIEIHSRKILKSSDYGLEDYLSIKERLEEFKEKYITPNSTNN